MPNLYNRREAIAAAAAFFGAVLASPAALAAFAEESAAILSGPLPESDPLATFEKFHVLSRLVTGRARLGAGPAGKLYPFFMEEPYGPEHIARTYAKLTAALSGEGKPASVVELVAAGDLGEGESWFVHHLVTTWYLGIYYHERLTRRVIYEDALIWDVVKDTVPVQGFSPWPTGYWADPPEVPAEDVAR